jgi:DNA recombination protein RmuC
LDKETRSLSAALRNNKVRGAWGEAQLKNIVESAGLLEHRSKSENHCAIR